MPTDKWLTAVKKRVKDGTSKTTYLSGWHILLNIEECEDYLLKFTKRLDKLKIVECEARGLRPKTHSPDNVWLADQIKFSLKEIKKTQSAREDADWAKLGYKMVLIKPPSLYFHPKNILFYFFLFPLY